LGLAEPEFVDLEVALRINLFRTENEVQDDSEKLPVSVGEADESALKVRETEEVRSKCAQSARNKRSALKMRSNEN
jgi:hypothetical protein